MDKPLKNDILRVTVEGYSSDGFGVARHNGYVIFIPAAARGDELLVRIVKPLKNHAFGIIERLVTPSPARISPCCPAFPKCGGCDFLHISYEEELLLKSEQVRDAMVRIGGFPDVLPETVPSPALLRSRNKALFPLCTDKNTAVFGFYRRHSHAVIPTADCPINSEYASLLAAAVAGWANTYGISIYDELSNQGLLRKVFTRCGEGGVHLCIVATKSSLPHTPELIDACRLACPTLCGVVLNVNDRQTNLALGEKCVTLWGEAALTDTLLGKSFELSPLSFYQVNHPQAEQLYRCVLALSDLDKSRDALDLYCGVGTITLSLAGLCRRVYGAEIVPRAIENARENARRNGVLNAEFFCADAGEAAKKLAEQGFSPYTVVCDPPRRGMDTPALDAVLSFGAENVIYVACDPASLARDAKYLCERGYSLKAFKAFDMFPRTANVETVCLLLKGK